MGVRRIQVSDALVAVWLARGVPMAVAVQPVADAEVLDVRHDSRRSFVELLVESPTFDGPGSEGRWVYIAEGKWDEFPIFLPTYRALPTALELTKDDIPRSEGQEPGDPDDRHGETEGA